MAYNYDFGGAQLSSFVKNEWEKHPETYILTEKQIAENEKKVRARVAEDEKRNPNLQPEEVPVRVELARLRSQHFTLRENAKATEICLNNTAGRIHLLEQNLTETIKKQRIYEEQGNVISVRYCEQAIRQIEDELLTVREKLSNEQRKNAASARALREWNNKNRQRVTELEAGTHPQATPQVK